ncbi:MAG: hypothetical protein AAGF77_02365 [Bacteroidota bacterium]
MNISDFKQLLQHSDTVLSPGQTRELETILEAYPFFQAAHALHLKGLKNLESYKYDAALKRTAAHTTDREILFEYLNSRTFDQNHIANSISERKTPLAETTIVSEEISPNPEAAVFLGGSEEEPLPQNLEDAEKILDPTLFNDPSLETIDAKTDEVDNEQQSEPEETPSFAENEKHSFLEWLQLAQRQANPEQTVAPEQSIAKRKKFELLEKFIETNPKIVPQDNLSNKVNISESTTINKDELMTETLAKVYLEQRKYKKAVQAFKILSLKYPEKSSFFADQIEAVKKLQKERD